MFNELLSNAPSLKPKTIGETITGTITEPASKKQATEFESGKPETWDNGDPKWLIVIPVRTTEGLEGCFYLNTWGSQKDALVRALHTAGVDADTALVPGTVITMTYTGDEPNKNPRLNATKLYEFKIELRANLGNTLEDPSPAPAEVPPAGAANPVALARQLHAQGIALPQIAQQTGLPESAVSAILATN